MVSLLRGLPAIIAEIEQRILACVPTAFSTDTWVKADRKQYEAQNDLLIDYWRHFDLDIPDSDPSPFAGNYAYQNREIRLDIYSWYSRAGANRVAGNPDVDWQALMLQDAHDLQRALQGPIVTADGSTGRLLYDNANRSEDDEEATLVVSFRLPVFLRGTAQVPALYLGPSQQHALDGGSKFYLVAQSDLACSGVLASSPAGCTHETALDLGSGTPEVIEVTCSTAGTYTFTLTGAGGTSTCTVVVFATTIPITFNLPVFSKNPGLIELTYPEGITGPTGQNIEGDRTWRNGLKHGQYLAREGASTAERTSQTFLLKIRVQDITYHSGAAAYTPPRQYLIQNYRADTDRKLNYGISINSQNLLTTTPFGHQIFLLVALSQSPTVVDTYFLSNIYYANSVKDGDYIRCAIVFNSGANKLYIGSLANVATSTITFSGTMGGAEYLVQNANAQWAKYNGILSNEVLTDFLTNDIWAADPIIKIIGSHEIDQSAPIFWDTSIYNRDLSAVNVPYLPNAAASGDYTDSQTVVPWATVPCVATESGTKTINGRRRRQGVPDRASEAEKWQLATATVVNGKVTVPMVFMD
jgi:hypothetical protein